MAAKILIVDDDPRLLEGFELILRQEGYEVLSARDFESAVEALSSEEPDLIICDILLGDRTGLDILQEVKARQLLSPMILITGAPDVESSAEAVRKGAFDYIPKPIRRETLLRIARQGVERKALLDSQQRLRMENIKSRLYMEAVFQGITEGVVTVDNEMQVVAANPSFGRICGRGDLKGRLFEPSHPDCANACTGILRQTLASGKGVQEVHVECRPPMGAKKHIILTCSPLKSDTGDAMGAVLVARNITELKKLREELEGRHRFHQIMGKSRKMQDVYEYLEHLAETDTTVLISGETGTGKNLAANAIHAASRRKDAAFIKVDCSALSENLLESELFGHVKGAFTGAIQDKKGRFEMAHKGTLLLDEIGDISPLIQLKLLRVLQEKEFERVGDSTTIRSDVRVIAATNRDLRRKVRQGEFREDLYYRIKVVEIRLPRLSERREDIPLLMEHFLDRFNNRFKKQIRAFSNDVVNAFMNYSWPGNIRELENAVEHGFVLCQGDIMTFDHLPPEIRGYFNGRKKNIPVKKEFTRQAVLNALKQTGWNKSKAARLLGMGRRTIYRKIEEFKITDPSD